jgi:hypothetical protein
LKRNVFKRRSDVVDDLPSHQGQVLRWLGGDRDFPDIHSEVRVSNGPDADTSVRHPAVEHAHQFAVLALGLCDASAGVGEVKDASHGGQYRTANL